MEAPEGFTTLQAAEAAGPPQRDDREGGVDCVATPKQLLRLKAAASPSETSRRAIQQVIPDCVANLECWDLILVSGRLLRPRGTA